MGISLVDGVGVSSLWVGVGDSSMSSRPVSLTFSSLEVDTDRLRFGKELGSSLKSSILWPLLKKKICFYVILLQICHFFPCVFTYQDRTSIEFKLVVEELEDLVKIVVVSALLLILSSSIWIPMVGTDKNSILRKSLGFGIPEGGLWWYSVML